MFVRWEREHERINFEAKLAKSVPPSVLPKIRRAPNEDQYLASELMFGAVHSAQLS